METHTTIEVGQILRVTPDRVRALLIAGNLQGRKFGRDWLVSAGAIAAYQRVRRRPGRPKSNGKKESR